MGEVKFVIKSFLLSAAIVLGLQLEIQGNPAEHLLSDYLRQGEPIQWIRSAINGGELYIKENLQNLPKQVQVSRLFSEDKPSKKEQTKVSSDVPEVEFPEEEITTVNIDDANDF